LRAIFSSLHFLIFLLKTIPFAALRAEAHLNKAIEMCREIGAKGTLASAVLDFGNLHKAKLRIEKAREHIAEAVQLFEKCKAQNYLNQAKNTLEALFQNENVILIGPTF
jgi:tetratricopeptide (TPR) repeat protein